MDFYESQAIYLQIADIICEQIITQNWKMDEKIPSVRQIAVDMEVNPNTTMRTYAYLQDSEVIYNKRGIGYFVADNGINKAMELLKNKFIANDLPRLFKSMDLLQLSFDDLQKIKNQSTSE